MKIHRKGGNTEYDTNVLLIDVENHPTMRLQISSSSKKKEDIQHIVQKWLSNIPSVNEGVPSIINVGNTINTVDTENTRIIISGDPRYAELYVTLPRRVSNIKCKLIKPRIFNFTLQSYSFAIMTWERFFGPFPEKQLQCKSKLTKDYVESTCLQRGYTVAIDNLGWCSKLPAYILVEILQNLPNDPSGDAIANEIYGAYSIGMKRVCMNVFVKREWVDNKVVIKKFSLCYPTNVTYPHNRWPLLDGVSWRTGVFGSTLHSNNRTLLDSFWSTLLPKLRSMVEIPPDEDAVRLKTKQSKMDWAAVCHNVRNIYKASKSAGILYSLSYNPRLAQQQIPVLIEEIELMREFSFEKIEQLISVFSKMPLPTIQGPYPFRSNHSSVIAYQNKKGGNTVQLYSLYSEKKSDDKVSVSKQCNVFINDATVESPVTVKEIALIKDGIDYAKELIMSYILTFNCHGQYSTNKFRLPENIYVLVPSRMGLDHPYILLPPKNRTDTFENIMYTTQTLKFQYQTKDGSFDSGWFLYKPGELVPNVSYSPFQEDDEAGNASSCEHIAKHHQPYNSKRMQACLKNHTNSFCPLLVPINKQPYSAYQHTNNQKFHRKLKICGRTTLSDICNNIRTRLGNNDNIKGYHNSSEFVSNNIVPHTQSPIILIPFACNSNSGSNNINLHPIPNGEKIYNIIFNKMVE